jgi:hypothetical protein
MRREIDRIVFEIAGPRYGVAHRRDLRAAGVSARAIDYRVSTGRLIPIHPQTYVVAGAPLTWLARLSAAVAWSRGAAGGRAAARLLDLPGFEDAPIEVVTTNRRAMPHSGVNVHHTCWLPSDQLGIVRNLACTSPERTVMDLFGIVDRRRAAIAMDHALLNGLVTLGSLDFCLFLTARRGRNGCGLMRECLRSRLGMTEFPNTALETVVFDMLVEGGLPHPELQVTIHDERGRVAGRPDFLYSDQKLIVEAHSRLWHEGSELEAGDRQRHERLVRLGFDFVYVTWADAWHRRAATVTRIRNLLIDRGWRPDR